jgi:hypothetical protein
MNRLVHPSTSSRWEDEDFGNLKCFLGVFAVRSRVRHPRQPAFRVQSRSHLRCPGHVVREHGSKFDEEEVRSSHRESVLKTGQIAAGDDALPSIAKGSSTIKILVTLLFLCRWEIRGHRSKVLQPLLWIWLDNTECQGQERQVWGGVRR